MNLLKIFSFSIISSILIQPLGLVAPVFAEEVRMEYSDPDHIHAPKVVDGVVYQYDENGNLVNDGDRVISWNQDNLPTKIEKDGQVVEFFYDANGQRIVKKSGGDKITYVSGAYQLSTINRSEGSPPADNQQSVSKYYFANGRTAQSVNDALSFLHNDHLGSTVLATDSNSQKLTEPFSYFPYGNRTTMQPFSHSSYLFTGQELDDELDLYNYNARLYSPKTGAFISADTLGGGNRYSYAANNPLIFTDPTGHMAAYDAGGGGGGGLDITPPSTTPNLPVIRTTTPINPTITYDPLHPDPSYYDPYTSGEFERAIVGMAAFSSAVVTGGLSLPAFIAYLQFAKDYYYYNYVYSAPSPTEGTVFFKSAQDATVALRFGEEFPAGGAGEFEALLKLSEVDPTHTARPLELTSEGIAMEGLGQPLLDYLHANPGEMGRVISEIETTVSRYHTAGLYHGDINVNNILMRGSTPVFIDPLEQRVHLVGEMRAFDIWWLSELPVIIQRFLWPTSGTQ